MNGKFHSKHKKAGFPIGESGFLSSGIPLQKTRT